MALDSIPWLSKFVRYAGSRFSKSGEGHLRKQLLIPFILVITVLMTGTLWALQSLEKEHIEEESQHLPHLLEHLLQWELANKTLLHQQLIEVLQSDKEAQEAWAQQDRAKLLEVARWSMRLFKVEGITHLYFIKPNRECFLRVHRPEEYGDVLDRVTLKRTVQEGKTVSGLELGRFFSFNLRTVVPWRIKGQLAGYVELSTDLQEAIASVRQAIPAQMFYLLSKEFLPRAPWEAEMRAQGVTPDWELNDKLALMQDTTPSWRRLLRQHFAQNGKLLKAFKDSEEKIYQVGTLPLVDIEQRPIGALLLLDDWTDNLLSLKRMRLTALLFSAIIFLVLGTSSYFFLGRIEGELRKARRRLEEEISDRKRIGKTLAENEQYLRTISDTMDAGILVVEAATRRVTDANRAAGRILGCAQEELIGKDCHDFMCMHDAGLCGLPDPCPRKQTRDQTMATPAGQTVHMRRTYSEIKIKDAKYVVQSLTDITDLKNLLTGQELNIALARRVLNIINPLHRYVDISDDLTLFVDHLYTPCRSEGGDHFFIRTIPTSGCDNAKTVLSLKDQSGHEVNCILRSIATDLIHNRILTEAHGIPLDRAITALNEELCNTKCFSGDDFLTAINAEIDHRTLRLRYVSAGHPGFVLIRGEEVLVLPEVGGTGSNLPLAVRRGVDYSKGEVDLKKGDKLIFYTDGLSEMPLQWGSNSFSRQDMIQIIRHILQQGGGSTIRDLRKSLLCEVSGGRFGRNWAPQDDVTMVAIEIEDCTVASHQEVLHLSSAQQVDETVVRLSSELASDWKRHGVHVAEWRLQTVLEESLRNAWRHGNREDPNKAIVVRWRCQNEAQIEVIDEGGGFDPQKLPNPITPERIMSETGRGIFMMRRCVDSLRWKEGGRQLIVSFAGAEPGGKEAKALSQAARVDSIN